MVPARSRIQSPPGLWVEAVQFRCGETQLHVGAYRWQLARRHTQHHRARSQSKIQEDFIADRLDDVESCAELWLVAQLSSRGDSQVLRSKADHDGLADAG